MSRHHTRLVGLLTLVLFVIASLLALPRLLRQPVIQGQSPVAQLTAYVLHRPTRFTAVDLSRSLKPRDPVFWKQGEEVVQAGYVEWTEALGDEQLAYIRWYDARVPADRCRFAFYRNHGRMEDAIELMFPPAKRQRIKQLIAEAMRADGQRIASRLGPVVERSLRESLPAIEVGFRASMAKHRAEFDHMAGRWNDEIIAQRLIPLAKSEIVPVVRKHGEPVVQEIGLELWDRASVWGFTWRAIYDRTPLPRKDLMKREWDRFVEQEAIPVVEDHADQIAAAIQKTIVEVAENPKVRDELAAAAELIANDADSRALVQTLLRESLLENQQLRQVWSEIWTSDEVHELLAEEGRALEPVIRQLGDELFGTREQGIDPGFARLLRNQVLQKDQRWVLATAARVEGTTAKMPVIEIATDRAAFPLPIFAAPP